MTTANKSGELLKNRLIVAVKLIK